MTVYVYLYFKFVICMGTQGCYNCSVKNCVNTKEIQNENLDKVHRNKVVEKVLTMLHFELYIITRL